MSLVAVLPLRDLATGKSRLRGVLPDPWRRAVILALAERTALAIREAGVAAIALISPDPALLAFAATLPGVTPVPQPTSGLNRALWEATVWERARGAAALLVLHGDLPAITPAAISSLAAHSTGGPTDLGEAEPSPRRPYAIIVGDRREIGTNALLVAPPGALPYRFGDASFVRHQAEGAQHGIPVVIHAAPELAFDLDTPADLRDLIQDWPGAARALCQAARRFDPTFPEDPAMLFAPQEVIS